VLLSYWIDNTLFLIREISNDLPIDELTLLSGNEILNDEKIQNFSYKFRNSFKTQVVSQIKNV
jgi:hypothetical protein